jgi:glucokinase
MLDHSQTRLVIGVDVGGTKCAAGLIAPSDGRLIASRLKPTDPQRGGEAVLADVIDMVRTLKNETPHGSATTAVGIGVAELVTPDGVVKSDATIRWRDIPIAQRITTASRLPSFVDADVRAAARGEAYFGAGKDLNSFLYVTVGTGISVSLVINKHPYEGARGLTGTFASGPVLIPNQRGELVSGPPLEQFAAGPAIVARFTAVRPEFSGAAPQVLALAEGGDSLARAIVESAGTALGAAIAQLVNVVDPEAVVIGGGLGLTGGIYRQSLRNALRDFVWSDLHRDVPLFRAELGNHAGIIGAALGAAMAYPL